MKPLINFNNPINFFIVPKLFYSAHQNVFFASPKAKYYHQPFQRLLRCIMVFQFTFPTALSLSDTFTE